MKRLHNVTVDRKEAKETKQIVKRRRSSLCNIRLETKSCRISYCKLMVRYDWT